MEVTRRFFLAGGAAFAGRALVGAASAEPVLFLALNGAVFREDMPLNPGWHNLCVTSSVWHLDGASYEQPVIRHQMTSLAYVIREEGDAVAAFQIDRRCWKGNEEADPDGIVGQAAREVAQLAQRSPIWAEASRKPLFVGCEKARKKPRLFRHAAEAPPIEIALLTNDEADAYMAEQRGDSA